MLILYTIYWQSYYFVELKIANTILLIEKLWSSYYLAFDCNNKRVWTSFKIFDVFEILNSLRMFGGLEIFDVFELFNIFEVLESPNVFVLKCFGLSMYSNSSVYLIIPTYLTITFFTILVLRYMMCLSLIN